MNVEFLSCYYFAEKNGVSTPYTKKCQKEGLMNKNLLFRNTEDVMNISNCSYKYDLTTFYNEYKICR